MPVLRLKPSPVLGIQRFASFDEFRPNEVIGGGISVPFEPKQFSAFRAILPLRDSLLVLQRSFARRLETNIGVDHGIGLVVPLSFNATINGCVFNDTTIALTRGRTPTQAVEPQANIYLMVRFNSEMRDRGWADYDDGLRTLSASPERLELLRVAIVRMFCLASENADPKTFDEIGRAMQETLIAGLDSILLPDNARRARPGSFDKHRRLVDRLDELARLRSTIPLYTEDVAQSVGVSLRTLQTAVQVVHGMSLHRYLVSRRLWYVRRQLITGNPTLTAKAVARANGFWHMGEFSRTYKAFFGELPSETLARVRS